MAKVEVRGCWVESGIYRFRGVPIKNVAKDYLEYTKYETREFHSLSIYAQLMILIFETDNEMR